MVIMMDTTVSVRKTILNLIEESREEDIKGTAFRRDSWMNTIFFSDVMDVVFFYISLQPDLKEIARINTSDFYALVEKVWGEWIKDQKSRAFLGLNSAWSSGPGPIGGTAGPAEMYMFYYPGVIQYRYLLEFFSYPEGLPRGWSPYRDHMKVMVFPKWKREKSHKKLGSVFRLAQMVCEAMRAKQGTGR
jgi:hypothetical protein